jgi:hypothetical protein
MTQFPLNDNLRDARRARREGYAGTINDMRLVWFTRDRRFTVPAVTLSAIAALTALFALALPVVGLARYTGSQDTVFVSPRLGYHFGTMWVAVLAVLAATALAVAAASWSGGPAPRRHGNPVLVAASALLGLASVAAAVYLLRHTGILALGALEHTGPFLTPKGAHGWQPGPYWPYRARPGLALWVCLAAGLVSLAPPVLLAVSALAGGARATSRAPADGREVGHLTSAST